MLWVVECASCGRPFEVESPVMPVAYPPPANIILEPHTMLKASSVPCMDRQGIGIGKKDEYVPRDRR